MLTPKKANLSELLMRVKNRAGADHVSHNAEAGTDTSALVESCLKTKEEGWRFVHSGLPQDGEVFEPWRSVLAAVEQLAAVRDVVGEGDEKTDCENQSIERLPTTPLPSFGLRQWIEAELIQN